MSRSIPRRTRAAFTLMEVMLVLVILVVLGSLAVQMFTGQQRSASLRTAQVQVDAIDGALKSYYLAMNNYPADLNGLLQIVLGRNGESVGCLINRCDRFPIVPSGNVDDGVFVRRRHICFEDAVCRVDRLDFHAQRLVAFVDRVLPLNAFAVRIRGDDDDLVLDRQRAEVDRNVPR